MSARLIFRNVSLILILFCVSSFGKYSGGTGEPNNPYRIATPNDLNSIGLEPNDWDKHFLMTADINMTGIVNDQFNVIGSETKPFRGVFDGNGFSISGFTYSNNTDYYVSLFGWVEDPNVEIRDLSIIDPNVSGRGYAGSLIGLMVYGKVINCGVTGGNVRGESRIGGLVGACYHGCIIIDCVVTNTKVEAEDCCAGGLVGFSVEGIINNCVSNCDINGDTEVGGLAGEVMDYSIIKQCMASGTVTGQTSVGGLVGKNGYWGLITESHAQSDVQGTNVVGGLVGYNVSDINKSWSSGSVVAGWICGGISGYNIYGGNIENCYSSCSVQGSSAVGGLVGDVYGADVIECYSSGIVSGESQVGGFIGTNGWSELSGFWNLTLNPDVNGIGSDTDPNVIGLPTAQMQKRGTFADAGWDMIDVWDIGENQTYPFLRTHLPSDINKDGETNLYDLAILALNWLAE